MNRRLVAPALTVAVAATAPFAGLVNQGVEIVAARSTPVCTERC